MASPDRFVVRRTPKGGVSMGWSLYSDYCECPQLWYLRYIQGGDGLRTRQHAVSEPMLYGALWHAIWRAHIGGHPLRAAAEQVIADDGLRPGEWHDLVNEVLADFQWFLGAPKTFRMTVLMAEQEMAIPVPCADHHPLVTPECAACGTHEMRGTLDLCGRIEADWGAETMLIDWKTVDKINDSRNWARYRSSRQITYYLALLARARPALATLRGLIGMVPSHVLAKLDRKTRKGDAPVDTKLLWAFRTQAHLDRIVADYRRACDTIVDMLQSGARFPENPKSCVGFGVCPMLPLCDADEDAYAGLMESAYVPRLSPRTPEDDAIEDMANSLENVGEVSI